MIVQRFPSFNLRGDLAKLDSTELETRIEGLFAERERLDRGPTAFDAVFGMTLFHTDHYRRVGRGPLRARIFYTLIVLFVFQESCRSGPGRIYLIDCELHDLMDECRRRLTPR